MSVKNYLKLECFYRGLEIGIDDYVLSQTCYVVIYFKPLSLEDFYIFQRCIIYLFNNPLTYTSIRLRIRSIYKIILQKNKNNFETQTLYAL